MNEKILEFTPPHISENQSNTRQKIIKTVLHDLIASRGLAWRLFLRDLSAQYRQSLLGVFWAIFPPIFTSAIFIILHSRNIISTTSIPVPYPVYVLIGTTLWQVFTDSVNAPLKATMNAKSYLVKIFFPREALILASFFSVLFNVLIRSILIIGVFVYYKIPIHWQILFSPIGILFLILLGMAIGILVTPIGMLYSDISTALPIILQLIFFATPIVYNPPDNFPFSLVRTINPISPILVTTREFLTIGSTENLALFIIFSAFSLLLGIFSLVLFRISLPIIIERLGT